MSLRISSWLAPRLRGVTAPVEVLARFGQHDYLLVQHDGQAPVMILLSEADPGPLSVMVRWDEAGAPELRAGVLSLGARRLDLNTAEVFDTGLPAGAAPDLAALAAAARGQGHASAWLAAVLGEAEDWPVDLRPMGAALRARDGAALGRGAQALLGLGAGLTPAGDDLLMGMMTALWLRDGAAAGPICAPVVAAAEGATTTISRAFLEAAAAGQVTADWHALIRGDAGTEAGALARVLAKGHSSGADTLAGFLWAGGVLAGQPVAARRM